ncbi:glutathione S-transferase family protein [Sphingopyxis flava]|uniref:Glutathione S-transferase n=1 Tax=Sphingopyxis flava TaxID=1507287 RepID=A0A1T5GQ85_9SPHN|nr:glutathione S-transferase family protein [Sphingopyxis flava]SKC10531.1 Glutathione S-transferase [Sphingopyxis flava]
MCLSLLGASPLVPKDTPPPILILFVGNSHLVCRAAAILAYLAQSFPDVGLSPAQTPYGFAQLTSFNGFLATTVHITLRHFSRPRIFADGEAAHAALRAKVPEMLNYYFGKIEDMLKDGRPYVHGDRYTASDPYLFIYTSYLHWPTDRCDLSAIPNVLAHRERILERPATKRALELEGIPDPALIGDEASKVVLDAPGVLDHLSQGC